MGALTHLEEEVGPRARRHIVPLLTKGSTARDSRAPRCFLRALEWSYIRRGARSACCTVSALTGAFGVGPWRLCRALVSGWFIGCCVCVLTLGVLSLSQSSGNRLLTGDW